MKDLNSDKQKDKFSAKLKYLASLREFIMVLVILGFTIIISVATPIFMTRLNIEAILMDCTTVDECVKQVWWKLTKAQQEDKDMFTCASHLFS